jgi:hypothetical protein
VALSYVTITELAIDGSAADLNGTAVFTPNQAAYAPGTGLVADAPVEAQVVGGQLKTLSGGALQLLATDNTLSFTTLTGFLQWSVQLTLGGVAQPAWSFSLPSSPGSRELFSLANTAAGSGGGVSSVTAGDASISIGGTSMVPTVETGTLDAIAALHPAAGNVTVNGHKVTGLASGTASSDAAALGQLPSPGSPLATTAGGSGSSYASLAALLLALLASGGGTMGAVLAPKVVTLADAATVTVNAALGNEFDLTLGGNRTIAAPSGLTNGQRLTFRIRQPSSGGPFSPAFASGAGGYSFGSGPAPAWSTAASACDVVAFDYDSVKNQLMCLGSAAGF